MRTRIVNHKSLLKLGITSAICFSAISISQASHANLTLQETTSQRTETLTAQAIALMSGEFVAAEAPTTGSAKIVEENGQKYLEIDSAFSTTDQAPDLQVLLDTVEQAPATYQETESGRYLNLGGLQSNNGAQRYPIPDFVDASQFQSVVIWCRMANATMGYAPLSVDLNASL